MVDAFAIREGMEVRGSDEVYVGRVDCLKDADVVLAAKDSETGGRHRLIPLSWVDRIESDDLVVHLNVTRDEAEAGWRELN